MSETILTNPTVQDVINYLSKVDPELPFRIEDPDTGWTISIVHTEIKNDAVWFSALYEEMDY